jgi:hypothetical protein
VSQFVEDLLKRGHEETSGTRGEVGERNAAGMGNEEDKQSQSEKLLGLFILLKGSEWSLTHESPELRQQYADWVNLVG